MRRSIEYQTFLDHIGRRVKDQLPRNLESTANINEIGWWKQHQIRRGLKHARYEAATPVELHLLRAHNVPFPWRAKERTENALKGEDFPIELFLS